jgi:ketosteroid isomerase-like protein
MSTSEESKALVLASYRAFAGRKRDEIAPFLAPDAEWIAPEGNGTAIALGQRAGFVGRAAIVTYLTTSLGGELFQDAKVELLTVVAEGETVVVEQLFEATVCNGRPYRMLQVFLFKLRDGLIREIRAYFDTASGASQIFGEETPRRLV